MHQWVPIAIGMEFAYWILGFEHWNLEFPLEFGHWDLEFKKLYLPPK